jgi:hypothetical protein
MGKRPSHIQNGSHDCHGVCESSGFEGETRQRVRATQSNQSKGRSDTKGGFESAHPEPCRGGRCSQASYLSLNQEISFTPLCGLASSYLSFLHGLPGEEA